MMMLQRVLLMWKTLYKVIRIMLPVANITKYSDGTYSVDSLDIDFTFRQVGTIVAKRRYRLARDTASWGAFNY